MIFVATIPSHSYISLQIYFIFDYLLIHSAFGGCSSYFHFGANKNSAAMNIYMQNFG